MLPHKFTRVVTKDGVDLGVALRLRHRPPADVDPGLKLFATYLELQSIQLGGTTFVPVHAIGDYDEANDRLNLLVNLKTVQNELWNREPDFVARGLGTVEELAAAPAA